MDEYQKVYSLPVEKIFSIYPLEGTIFWAVTLRGCPAHIETICGAFAENLMFSTNDFPTVWCKGCTLTCPVKREEKGNAEV